MSKAFLSHSSKQKPLVEKVASKLGKDNVVYDSISFGKGEKTINEILNGISSADVFVLFLSDEALNSDWVQFELNTVQEKLRLGTLSSFTVFVIDGKVDHRHPKLPEWVRNYYNIQPETNANIITNKIFNLLVETRLENSKNLQAEENLFTGRYDLIQHLEELFYSSQPAQRKCLIVSGVEGIGRRTFARRGLEGKLSSLGKSRHPISIPFDDYESIEDLILKLANISNKAELEYFLTPDALFSDKLEMAYNIVMDYINANELIFIIDNGAIVQPNRVLAPWFVQLLNKLPNTLSFCLVSIYRLNFDFEYKYESILHVNLQRLKPIDCKILLNKYLAIYNLFLKDDDVEFLVERFNGMPEQVLYAAKMIAKEGLPTAKNKIDSIVEFGTAKVKYILNLFAEDKKALELLALISHVSYINYNSLKDIINDDAFYIDMMDRFLAIGVYDNVGPAKEDIYVNSAIADYVQRNKIALSQKHLSTLRNNIKAFLSEDSQDDILDVSDFLAGIKAAISSKAKVNPKYLIPSLFLKNILTHYQNGEYKAVVSMATSFLENKNRYDDRIIFNVTYTLCQALARRKDPRFEMEVKFFDHNQFQSNFLRGFAARMSGDFHNALVLMQKALRFNSSSAQAKREIVNILLSQGEFDKALDWAHDNYKGAHTNVLHVQAYFTCLVKKRDLNQDDLRTIEHLLAGIKSLVHYRVVEITLSMEAEYAFYISKYRDVAVEMLKKYLASKPDSAYVKSTLKIMYKSMGKLNEVQNLGNEIVDYV